MSNYDHIARAVFARPWAIHPAKLEAIKAILAMRVQGVPIAAEEVAEIVAAAGPRRAAGKEPGHLGVLPLQGVIMPRAGLMAQSSGAVSLEQWMKDFRSMMADPDIGSILLDIDSPGGDVTGIPEAAAEIRAAREDKPIHAIANSMAASAGYWLASQANTVAVTPSGWVGSIGVYSAHEDLSQFMENEGVKTTFISAGKYKVEGNPYEPLSDEARAHIQSQVDDYYSMFVNDVAKGRGVTASVVRKEYGEGRMLLAKPAKDAGMVDSVDTFGGAVGAALKSIKVRGELFAPGWEALEDRATLAEAAEEPTVALNPELVSASRTEEEELEIRKLKNRARLRSRNQDLPSD